LGVTGCGLATIVSPVVVDPFARDRLWNDHIRVPEFGIKIDPELRIEGTDIGKIRGLAPRIRAARCFVTRGPSSPPMHPVRNQDKERHPTKYQYD